MQWWVLVYGVVDCGDEMVWCGGELRRWYHSELLFFSLFFFFFGIITKNPPEVWPVCTLPTRGSKLITLHT